MVYVMERLESWRTANGLRKTEMAKLLGCNSPQQYGNWVARNSLPKEFFKRAADILGDDASDIAPPGPSIQAPERYEDSIFSRLTHDEKRQVVFKILPELDADDRAAALRFLLELD